MMSQTDLKFVKLSRIKENPVALRNVNRQGEEYIALVDSIRAHGVLQPILVAPLPSEDGEDAYRLVDGLHRFSGAKDAGLEEIPCFVRDSSEAEMLVAQVITNVHKVETKPVEYSKQLMRILSSNPIMSMTELANKLNKSPQWLGERLGLLKIENNQIQALVNEGKINLSNAYALAKLPTDEQASFVDRAQTETPQVFIPAVNARVKELRDAKRQGKDASPESFTPVAHLQKLSAIKSEFESPTVATVVLAAEGANTALEGWTAAIKWALHMDKPSIEAAKAKEAARVAKLDAERAKKKAERDAKKQAEAQTKAAAEAANVFNV